MSDETVSPVRPYRIVVHDSGDPGYVNRIMIGTASTGWKRDEWISARYGQIVPVNWSMVQMNSFLDSFNPLRYQVADAQNLIVKEFIDKDFEWCFRGDTIVETQLGGKKIKDIQPNELVRTHLGRYRKVNKVMKRELKQRASTLWIKTEFSTIKCTEEHPFMSFDSDFNTVWVKASVLKEGSYLYYPVNDYPDVLDVGIVFNTNGNGYHNLAGGTRNGTVLDKLPVTRELARFMGLYLAEGHSERDAICLTFNNNEKEYIEFVSKIYRDVFGRDATIRSSWSTQVKLNIRNLATWFKKQFGDNAREKRIPEFVFKWNTINRLEFLRGYLDGDGSYKENRCAYGSASFLLMHDLSFLILGCGLESSPQYELPPQSSVLKTGHVINNSGSYQCSINHKSLEKLFDLLNAKSVPGYLAIPVKAVESHPLAANLIDSAVYNLEVEEDNSYIADCAAVHNCFFLEHDNILPVDGFLRLNRYMEEAKYPVISALYYTKSRPSEPLIFRGRGVGVYKDWKPGDLVWCDGVPTGALLVHRALLKAMWDESPEYLIRGRELTRRVFDSPRYQWFDPETNQVNSVTGTSDLDWCTRVMKGDYFRKSGWTEFADKEFPFVVDTGFFCRHIDNSTGEQFP